MKTLRAALLTLLATGAVTATQTASALPSGWYDTVPAWSSTASACSVDESSTGKYEFSGTQFRYSGDNVSPATSSIFGMLYQPITIRCNVTPMYDYVPAQQGDLFEIPASWKSVSWNSLVVGYKDPDGISGNALVSASLRRLDRTTMTESTVASFSSNSFAPVVAGEEVKQFSHTFDFLNSDYYVEINLTRKDKTVATPVVYSVRLTNGGITSVIH